MQRVSARVRMTTVTMPPRTWEQAHEPPKLNKQPANVNASPGDSHYHRMQERMRQTKALLIRLRAHFEENPGVELYSVEAAKMLGCRRVSYVASLLHRLERGGFLDSYHATAAASGHGRRYYKLREVPR